MPMTPRLPITVLAAAVFVLSLSAVVSNRTVDDWPQWRGVKRDGTSAERGLLKVWPAAGPALAWRATGAGDGYSYGFAHEFISSMIASATSLVPTAVGSSRVGFMS